MQESRPNFTLVFEHVILPDDHLRNIHFPEIAILWCIESHVLFWGLWIRRILQSRSADEVPCSNASWFWPRANATANTSFPWSVRCLSDRYTPWYRLVSPFHYLIHYLYLNLGDAMQLPSVKLHLFLTPCIYKTMVENGLRWFALQWLWQVANTLKFWNSFERQLQRLIGWRRKWKWVLI